MKTNVLIYSKNQYFLDCLSNYVMNSDPGGFDFAFYPDQEKAAAVLQSNSVDVLLADEGFLKDSAASRPGMLRIGISNRTVADPENGGHELNIYQRGMDILGDLRKIISAASGKQTVSEEQGSRIIAFYSPQGGTGKTTLAYVCALLCAARGASVYLNLEEFGYTGHLYQADFRIRMEEVLLALNDDRDLAEYLTNGLVRDSRNVSVMPMMENYEDLADLSADHIEKMLKTLRQVSGADLIFVDLSGGLNSRNRRVLEMADHSFWVFDDTETGRGKMERLRHDRSAEKADFLSRAYFVINKCKVRQEDKDAIRVPWSDSLDHGADVETVLAGNRDFYEKCREIVAAAER